METLILDRLKAELTGFRRIALADTITPVDYPSWPAAYVYTLAEEAEHAPTRAGERQQIDQQIGIQVADRRGSIAASRRAVRQALVGWWPIEGALAPAYFARGQVLQLSEQYALWLDIYVCRTVLINEPQPR